MGTERETDQPLADRLDLTQEEERGRLDLTQEEEKEKRWVQKERQTSL